jgi:hypothetical protein
MTGQHAGRTRLRRLTPLAGVILLLAGCDSGAIMDACPAIAWGASLSIELDAPRPGVHLLVCDGDCPPTAGEVATPQPLPTPTGTGEWLSVSGDSETGWTASTDFAPPAVGYRLRAADGTILAQALVEPEWVQVGGTERCGGPMEAAVVLDTTP